MDKDRSVCVEREHQLTEEALEDRDRDGRTL